METGQIPPQMPSLKTDDFRAINVDPEVGVHAAMKNMPMMLFTLAATGCAIWLIVLIFPVASIFLVPMLLVVGIATLIVSQGIIKQVRKAKGVISSFYSPMGRFAMTINLLGCSPLILITIGILPALTMSIDDAYTYIRVLITIFTIFFVPACLYLRWRCQRHLATTMGDANG